MTDAMSSETTNAQVVRRLRLVKVRAECCTQFNEPVVVGVYRHSRTEAILDRTEKAIHGGAKLLHVNRQSGLIRHA